MRTYTVLASHTRMMNKPHNETHIFNVQLLQECASPFNHRNDRPNRFSTEDIQLSLFESRQVKVIPELSIKVYMVKKESSFAPIDEDEKNEKLTD